MIPTPIDHRIEHLLYASFERRHDSRSFNYVKTMTTKSERPADFNTPLRKPSGPLLTLIEQYYYSGQITTFRYENKSTTLKFDECLQEFVSIETLDSSWFCDQARCKRKTKANK
ncbi:unnamed protein product [Rotaria magnacalcarata]|uniref:Uncharacterized protein n=1 Tax=Rotaria magnacalcarata TaxID=392030 RepID=A0A819XJT8_9BILA|nr:unnamed protein product [Rotaria magnacalcarata]CAF1300917.1 unnamed protein product [Rotaria magnacalcarata]CAF1981934.1 unnamed protein product [Rotaria magnacalcarata]CAF2156322.1 unnamed protein product [Rotaria magnacalcarata]CAF2193015.1 unnamed protein product [Rotaria magnacalcarata]